MSYKFAANCSFVLNYEFTENDVVRHEENGIVTIRPTDAAIHRMESDLEDCLSRFSTSELLVELDPDAVPEIIPDEDD